MAAVSVRCMRTGSYTHLIALLVGVGNVKFLVYNIIYKPSLLSSLLSPSVVRGGLEVVQTPLPRRRCNHHLRLLQMTSALHKRRNLCYMYVHSLHITCMQKNPRIDFQYIFKFLNELLAAWRLPGHSSYIQVAWDHKLP